MSESDNPSGAKLTDSLIERFQGAAKESEERFLSLARDVYRAVNWTQRQTADVSESAVAAAKTTTAAAAKLSAAHLEKIASWKKAPQISRLLGELVAMVGMASPDDVSNLRDNDAFWELIQKLHKAQAAAPVSSEAESGSGDSPPAPTPEMPETPKLGGKEGATGDTSAEEQSRGAAPRSDAAARAKPAKPAKAPTATVTAADEPSAKPVGDASKEAPDPPPGKAGTSKGSTGDKTGSTSTPKGGEKSAAKAPRPDAQPKRPSATPKPRAGRDADRRSRPPTAADSSDGGESGGKQE